MKFAKKNDTVEVLTALNKDMDLLCKSVFELYGKVLSKMTALETQMTHMDKKLDDLKHKLYHNEGSYTLCTIS
ncbi:unnamed protein product [Sphacelaria rigidula]